MNEHHKTTDDLQAEQADVEAAKKDPVHFGVLYEKYYRSVFVFVHRRTGDEDHAADIVSNTFLKAMLSLEKYTFRGVPFSAWLFRIALNELNMFFRKTKRDMQVSLDKTDLGKMIAESGEKDSDENRTLLLKALATLKPDEMQLIELRFFEKRQFAEVGEILGITENNTKVKTYRILDKLKMILTRAGAR